MIRTFPDAGLLIAASRGDHDSHTKAHGILLDPDRQWVWTRFLWLETVPAPAFNRYRHQAAYLEAFFGARSVRNVERPLPGLLGDAATFASTYGLTAIDALHVAAAVRAKCDEFITLESNAGRASRARGSPLYRVKELRVVHMDDVES